MRRRQPTLLEQIEGLPDGYYAPPAKVLDPIDRIKSADRFFRNTGAVIRHGGNQAYYSPVMDYIHYLNSQAVSPTFH